MKLPALLAGSAGLVVLAGCSSQAPYVRQHWSPQVIGPRMSRAFLSYDPETDGPYVDFQWKKKQDINLTLSRHFFNYNPDNPFQAESDDFYGKRPPHSLFPAPHRYIHLEGLAIGALLYAGGAPMILPLPIDSLIATFDQGGTEEFVDGIGVTVRPIGVLTASFLHDQLGFPETKGSEWREQD